MGIKNLLPARSEIGQPDRTVVLDLSSEEADEIFSVLSSSTARSILASLHEEPKPASEIASSQDLTLQNVNYHIQKLLEADLIEIADFWYSETGNEMKVYAPSKKAVMVLADQPMTQRLREMVLRVFSMVLLVGGAAALFRFALVERFFARNGDESGGEGATDAAPADEGARGDAATDDAADSPESPELAETDGSVEVIIDQETTIAEALEALPLLLDPGVVFVLGAVVALLVVGAFWGYRRYRRQAY